MASHSGHERCVDMGTISVAGEGLEAAQQALREAVAACQRAGKRTLVLGGGHETAFGHGAGVLDAFPGEKVGIINPRCAPDLRIADQASSGTPFRQLALECDAQQRFHYTCIGASRGEHRRCGMRPRVVRCGLSKIWRCWTPLNYALRRKSRVILPSMTGSI